MHNISSCSYQMAIFFAAILGTIGLALLGISIIHVSRLHFIQGVRENSRALCTSCAMLLIAIVPTTYMVQSVHDKKLAVIPCVEKKDAPGGSSKTAEYKQPASPIADCGCDPVAVVK